MFLNLSESEFHCYVPDGYDQLYIDYDNFNQSRVHWIDVSFHVV